MRIRTVVAVLAVVGMLGGALTAGLFTGGAAGGDLQLRWLSDTGVPVTGNHHAVAAGRVDGEGMVFAPVSGEHGTDQCRLVALYAENGSERWHRSIPPGDCWTHSMATLTLADVDGDGTPEVVAPTMEEEVYALDASTGEPRLVHDLSSYGYSQAAVGPLAPGSPRQVAVVDAKGTVYVIHPNGTAAWTRGIDSYVWASPAIADFDGAGEPGDGGDGRDDGEGSRGDGSRAGTGNQLAVGFGTGVVTVYRGDGSVLWNRTLPDDGSPTWMTTGDANGDGARDVIPSTDAGLVYALSGTDGRVLWSRDLGDFAAVSAFGDGDGDGAPEVYATARDGELRALSARNGSVEWTTTLVADTVQMMPPPVLGDVNGDGDPEVVAVTNDGAVDVVDPATGEVLASYEREVPIWERATLADTDGDDDPEIYVIYGDGRVAALEYAGS